ncbi:hypothetical protein [Streptomyces sp. 8L]|uniref:hypothetical protein n=1 Tax=Streptomyces sp. 8L TaxID=2877242 RepID=UPI001CD42A80|nr:hypothetical protein [Streptomyces sp. 8L]MCA1218698.1 hypothetical protein [Streptomyces sp. 8L]
MSVIITGLREVETALSGAPAVLDVKVKQAVTVTARKVRDSARQRVSGYAHLPAYPYSITYDVTESAAGAEAEIGPDKDRTQGPLGNLIEYGSRKNAPIPHMGPALEENADDLEKGVETAVTQALGLA